MDWLHVDVDWNIRTIIRHFPDDMFKSILFNENVWIPNNISLTFVPKDPINNYTSLVQIMAWRRPGGKPLSAPIMVRLPTHICVIWPKSKSTCAHHESFRFEQIFKRQSLTVIMYPGISIIQLILFFDSNEICIKCMKIFYHLVIFCPLISN